MTRPHSRHASWALFTMVALACAEETPKPALISVTPRVFYSDRVQRLTLLGRDFLPRYHFDLDNGRRRAQPAGFSGFVSDNRNAAELNDFVVKSPELLEASLEAGLLGGVYNITIVDPRGTPAILTENLVALGPDQLAPRLTLVVPAPGELLAPGVTVAGHAVAEDEELRSVAWQAVGVRGSVAEGRCDNPAPAGASPLGVPLSRIDCEVRFVVPADHQPGESFSIEVEALDGAPRQNRTALSRSFALRARPVLASIDPPRGASDGGTEVVIRGQGLAPGTRVFFGAQLLSPDGGTLVDERTIIGHAPSGPPGPAVIRLVTPLGEVLEPGRFVYLAPPVPTAVLPAVGADSGGTEVRVLGVDFTPATRILFGPSLALAVPLAEPSYLGPTEIRGRLPAGKGEATIFAVDPEAGVGRLPAAFAWKAAP